MSLIILAAGLLLIAGVLAAWSTRRDAGGLDASPYRKAGALLTPAERAFHAALGQVAGRTVTVFGKVRVADVVVPAKGLTRRARERAVGALDGGHFDFLLCHRHDLSVVCAIQIDARASRSQAQRRRDACLDEVCASVGMPLLRVAAKPRYGVDELGRLLAPYLSLAVSRAVYRPQTPPEDAPDDKLCPNCRAFMIVRVAVDRNRTGGEYWTCNGYPKCGYVEAINA
jgi:predicted RNA-binding Zn-ribbon protein involved in translation (DUF1610 family)